MAKSSDKSKIDCTICCYTKTSDDITKCPYCDIVVCKKCIKTFILGQKKVDSSCMNCKNIFTRTALVSMFDSTHFIENKLKNHIKNVMYEEEKIRIPEILHVVAERNKYLANNHEFSRIESEFDPIYNDLSQKIYRYEKEENYKSKYEYYKLYYEREGIKKYLDQIRPRIFNANDYLYRTEVKTDKPKNVYTYPCANKDCLGRINLKGHCDACDKITCMKCFIFIGHEDLEHVCKEEDLATAKYIKKNSKPCPKCGISISHGGGCDQMWCANCHYVFDWATGVKETGNIHNPEYFKYMRDNNISIPRYRMNNNPCDDILTRSYNNIKKVKNRLVANALIDFYRVIVHITNSTIRILRQGTKDLDTRQQRYELVIKKITEQQFKTNIFKNYKHNKCIEERLSIVQTLRDILQDEFVMILSNEKEYDYINMTKEQFNTIAIKLNDCINAAIKSDKNVIKCYGYCDNKNLEYSEHKRQFIPVISLL